MGYSVIIPVHNIAGRGMERLDLSLYSLSRQNRKPDQVIISDSSEPGQAVTEIAEKYGALHLREEREGFNMPYLFNRGIEASKSEYTLCTGADFLYHPTLFERYQQIELHDRFLVKEVWMLPNCPIDYASIDKWAFRGRPQKHPHGRLADGIQYAPTAFFRDIGGYDERMAGWSGMDNDMHNRAKAYGMNCIWVTPGVILHIWHPIEKGKKKEDIRQSVENWKIRDSKTEPIVRNYIRK